jgi:hypothetical protein
MKLSEEPIIHPLLMQSLQGFYPSLCAIGNLTTTQDAANQPIETFVANKDLQAIPCYVQPAQGAETRQRMQVVELNQWLIGLQGFYPQITQADQAFVDEVIYNIIRVAHDDHETATYLTCEKVS